MSHRTSASSENVRPVLAKSEAMEPVDHNSTGPQDADVGDGWGTYVFDALVVINAGTDVLEESFTASKQDRHNR
jgi:hypothetical protein